MSGQARISSYNITMHNKQTSDEHKEKYILGDCQLIQYQVLQTLLELYDRQSGELPIRSREWNG